MAAVIVLEHLVDLLTELDRTFVTLRERFPEEVRCRPGCADCYHALFTVSFAESLLIRRYLDGLSAASLAAILRDVERAVADWALLMEKGRGMDRRALMAAGRLRCPLLGEDDRCRIYPARPATCRIYGLPTEIAERGHVCGFSGFVPGENYPSVKMDRINGYLLDMSQRLADGEAAGRGGDRY